MFSTLKTTHTHVYVYMCTYVRCMNQVQSILTKFSKTRISFKSFHSVSWERKRKILTHVLNRKRGGARAGPKVWKVRVNSLWLWNVTKSRKRIRVNLCKSIAYSHSHIPFKCGTMNLAQENDWQCGIYTLIPSLNSSNRFEVYFFFCLDPGQPSKPKGNLDMIFVFLTVSSKLQISHVFIGQKSLFFFSNK